MKIIKYCVPEKVVLKGRAALRSFRKSEYQRDFQTGILGISSAFLPLRFLAERITIRKQGVECTI
jgi:hypothetical protein